MNLSIKDDDPPKQEWTKMDNKFRSWKTFEDIHGPAKLLKHKSKRVFIPLTFEIHIWMFPKIGGKPPK